MNKRYKVSPLTLRLRRDRRQVSGLSVQCSGGTEGSEVLGSKVRKIGIRLTLNGEPGTENPNKVSVFSVQVSE